MSIDERSRHALFVRLEELLGADQATTLMEHLPPVGWADVATKRDLDALEARMDLRFDALEERMDLRFDALEERTNLRFDALDERTNLRFDAFEASVGIRFDTTSRDLEGLEQRMDLRFATTVATMQAGVSNQLATQTRTIMFSMLGWFAAVVFGAIALR